MIFRWHGLQIRASEVCTKETLSPLKQLHKFSGFPKNHPAGTNILLPRESLTSSNIFSIKLAVTSG